jgi:hypothetical protein
MIIIMNQSIKHLYGKEKGTILNEAMKYDDFLLKVMNNMSLLLFIKRSIKI